MKYSAGFLMVVLLAVAGCSLPPPVKDSARYFRLEDRSGTEVQWHADGLDVAVQIMYFSDLARSRRLGYLDGPEWKEFTGTYWVEDLRDVWIREVGNAVSEKVDLQSFSRLDASLKDPDCILQVWVDDWTGNADGSVGCSVRWRILVDGEVLAAGNERFQADWDGSLEALPGALLDSLQLFSASLGAALARVAE